MKILALWEGMGGVEYHRLYTPLKRLQIDHSEEIAVSVCQRFTHGELPSLKQYDLVIFNKYLGALHYEILQELGRHRIPYIVDVDDYWILPKGHVNFKYWREHKLKQAIIDAIKYADGVTCTTPQLAAHIQEINPDVCILPNALDLTDEQWNGSRNDSSVIRFGWVGGVTHQNDLQIISDAISMICEEYTDNVQFILCGYQQNNWIWESQLTRFGMADGKIRPQVKVSMEQPVNEYGNFYRLFDVALAPLENTKWNNCKSELKIIEAAAYGLPVIASAVAPYMNHTKNNGVKFVLNTPDAWYNAIKDVITKQPDGKANKAYCQQHHNLEEINIKRLEYYKCKARLNISDPM